jgi:uncharacterized C2H2 Zn-finger protein
MKIKESGCTNCKGITAIPNYFINISRERDMKPPLEEIQPYFGVSKCPYCGTYFYSDRDYKQPFEEKVHPINPEQALKLLKEARPNYPKTTERVENEIRYIEGSFKKTTLKECSICKDIPESCSSDEGDAGLPEKARYLEVISGPDLVSGGGVENNYTKRCPECGTLYEYMYQYEFLVPRCDEFSSLKRITDNKKAEAILNSIKKNHGR